MAEHDIVVVNYRFRNSFRMVKALGFDVCMPDILNGCSRFDTLEVNRSHFISKVRWIAESTNGRIKHFEWFN